jgi:hypothetical protein
MSVDINPALAMTTGAAGVSTTNQGISDVFLREHNARGRKEKRNKKRRITSTIVYRDL